MATSKDISMPSWMVGVLSRKLCEEILTGTEEGCFLVRAGSAGPVLSIRVTQGIRHCQIHTSKGQFWISPVRKFTSITALVQSCFDNQGLLIDDKLWVRLLDPQQENTKEKKTSSLTTGSGDVEHVVAWTCSACRCQNMAGSIACAFCKRSYHDSTNASGCSDLKQNTTFYACRRCHKKYLNLAGLAQCLRSCESKNGAGSIRAGILLDDNLGNGLSRVGDEKSVNTSAVNHPLARSVTQQQRSTTAIATAVPHIQEMEFFCCRCSGRVVGDEAAFTEHLSTCHINSFNVYGESHSTAAEQKQDTQLPQFWVCVSCSAINQPYSGRCDTCGIPYEALQSPWTCSQCKCGNSGSADIKHCGGCGWIRSDDTNGNRDDSNKQIGSLRKRSISMSGLNRTRQRAIVRGLMRDRNAINKRHGVSIREADRQAKFGDLLEHIESYCATTGVRFLNPDFPPALRSLYRNGKYPAQDTRIVAHHWRRIHDVVVPGGAVPGAVPSAMPGSSSSMTTPADGGDGSARDDGGGGGGVQQWEMMAPLGGTTAFFLPSDIIQGDLGNCWFLSALALVATNADLMNNILISKCMNHAGVYQVSLFDGGEWRPVLVDDTFPCLENGTLAYSRSRQRHLWVPLIEKAAATMYGSYEALRTGSIVTVLNPSYALSLCPCESIFLSQHSIENTNKTMVVLPDTMTSNGGVQSPKAISSSALSEESAASFLNGSGGRGLESLVMEDAAMEDRLWAQLCIFHDKGYLLGASSSDQASVEQNIVPAHAYSIKHVWSPAANVRLLCLCNPTGRETWTGPWSDGTPEWVSCDSPLNTTTTLPSLEHATTTKCTSSPSSSPASPQPHRHRIVRTAAPDGGHTRPGEFWISFNDFRRNFPVVDVCKVSHDWDSVRLDGLFPLNPSDTSTCFQIQPVRATHVNVSLMVSDAVEAVATDGSDDKVTTKAHSRALPDPDLGIAILSVSEGEHVLNGKLVAYTSRRIQTAQNCEAYLADPSSTYVVVPLSFNRMNLSGAPMRFVCDFYSSEPLMLEAVKCPPELVTHVVTNRILSEGSIYRPFNDDNKDRLTLFELDSQFVVENRSRSRTYSTTIKALELKNYTSSRIGLLCCDTVPPQHRQLLCAFTPTRHGILGSVQYRINFDVIGSCGRQNGSGKDGGKGGSGSSSGSIRDMHDPRLLSAGDMHKPVLISTSTVCRKKDRGIVDPYAEWTGGGIGGKGAFGGGSVASDEDISALLDAFLNKSA